MDSFKCHHSYKGGINNSFQNGVNNTNYMETGTVIWYSVVWLHVSENLNVVNVFLTILRIAEMTA